MTWKKRTCGLVLLSLLVAGCAGKTKTVTIDFTKRSGVYVVGFSADEAVRSLLENQMVSDFEALSIKARASHIDIDEIVASSRDESLAAANELTMMTVLLINKEILVYTIIHIYDTSRYSLWPLNIRKSLYNRVLSHQIQVLIIKKGLKVKLEHNI
jgi:hypothetical protein